QVDTSFIPSWLGLVTATGLLPPTYSGTDPARALDTLNQHAQNVASFQAPVVLDAMRGGSQAYDGPFYRERSPVEVGYRVRAPSWPSPGVAYRQLYLSGPAESLAAGALRAKPPAAQPADTLPWQPLSGACSRSTVQWTAGGGSGTLCESDNELNDATGLSYDL